MKEKDASAFIDGLIGNIVECKENDCRIEARPPIRD